MQSVCVCVCVCVCTYMYPFSDFFPSRLLHVTCLVWFICFFIYCCAGAPSLHVVFSCAEQGRLSSCGMWASRWMASCCGAWPLGRWGFSSSLLRVSLLRGLRDPPRPGVQIASPTLPLDSSPVGHQGNPRNVVLIPVYLVWWARSFRDMLRKSMNCLPHPRARPA